MLFSSRAGSKDKYGISRDEPMNRSCTEREKMRRSREGRRGGRKVSTYIPNATAAWMMSLVAWVT
jgi:hypothetical protein